MGTVDVKRARDDRFRRLVVSLDDACATRRWSEVSVLARDLSKALSPRLEKLARSMVDFVDEGEMDLAVQMWAHLREAIDGERA